MAQGDRYFDYTTNSWRQQSGAIPNSSVDPFISGPSSPNTPPDYYNPQTGFYQEQPMPVSYQNTGNTTTTSQGITWNYDPNTGGFTAGPTPPAPSGQQGDQVSLAAVQMAGLSQQDRQFAATEARQSLEHADSMALAREQLAADTANRQATIAAQQGISQAQIAANAAEGAANRAMQLQLAEMENALRKQALMLQAATASGYIPKSLADQLGIQAGPTLETQQVAWARFKDAMNYASNPRDIVSYLYLQQGIQPPAGAGQTAPIPFLQALSNNQGLPVTNIGANQEAISTAARGFTANQLQAMPSLIQNEAINPAALAPIGGTDFLSQLQMGKLPPVQGFSGGIFGNQKADFLKQLQQPSLQFGGI